MNGFFDLFQIQSDVTNYAASFRTLIGVTAGANLTGPVTSIGTATFIANGAISNAMLANGAVANLSGTNSGDNSANSQYAADYRAANFVAGTHYLAPNGSAAALTGFPTLNQNTTGNAATVITNANLTGHVTSVGNAATLGAFTKAQLDTAVSDGNVLYVGDAPTAHNHVGSAITSGTVDPVRLGSGASISTKFLRGDSTWQTIADGGDALTSSNLSQFAATTSLQLLGVMSDETGTGALVFATSPTFVTPILGTPTSGVATNLTGTAAGLTAGLVTTNANLTGHVTSVGNAAVLGAFTKAQLDTAVSDGNVLYVGDAPTAHNQAWSTITTTPTTLSGYGISDAITAATAASTYQPIDSDLTAIAALTTTGYGRAFLALVDATAARTALALGTLATQSGTFSGTSSGTNTGDNAANSLSVPYTGATGAVDLGVNALTAGAITASGALGFAAITKAALLTLTPTAGAGRWRVTDSVPAQRAVWPDGTVWRYMDNNKDVNLADEVTYTPSGTTQTIPLNDGPTQTLLLSSATGTVTATLTIPSQPSSGRIIVRQGATPRLVTLAVSAGTLVTLGLAPPLDAANTMRVYSWTYDGTRTIVGPSEVSL